MDEQRILENLNLFWFSHNILAPSPPSSPCLSSSSTTATTNDSVEQTHLTNTEVSVKKDYNYPKHSKTSNPLHQTQNRGPMSIKSLPESSLECNAPSHIPAPNLENGAIKIPETSNRSRKKSRDSGTKRGTKGCTYAEYKDMKGSMDLGFSFGESEADARLVSTIRGLQRLGKRTYGFPRPESQLLHWRIPSSSDGMAMKEHLKFWAHAVACAVK